MKMYRKDLFDGLRFEQGRLHEDLYITYKLLDRAKIFILSNLQYYYYCRNNPNSITNNYREKNLIDEHDACKCMIEYFSGRNDIKNELYRFVFWHYFYLLLVSENLPATIELNVRRREIRKWMLLHVNNKYITFAEAIKVLARSYFKRSYLFLKYIIKMITRI